MSLKVYVAGSSGEIDRAKAATAALRAAGVVVVSTWPEVVEAVGDANPPTASREERLGWALEDLRQVELADVVLLLCPWESAGRGAYLEAGYALGLDIPVVAAGRTLQSVFCSCFSEHETDAAAIAEVVRVAALRDAPTMDLKLKEALVHGPAVAP